MNENAKDKDSFECFSETSIDDFLSENSNSKPPLANEKIFSDVIFDTSKIFTFSGDKSKQSGKGKRKFEDSFQTNTERESDGDDFEAKVCKTQTKKMEDIECIKLSVLELAKVLKTLTEEVREIKETQLKLLKYLEKSTEDHNANQSVKAGDTNDLFVE